MDDFQIFRYLYKLFNTVKQMKNRKLNCKTILILLLKVKPNKVKYKYSIKNYGIK